MLYYVVFILLIIIVTLVYILVFQRHKHLKETVEDKKELLKMTGKCSLYIKEINSLKKLLTKYEEKEYVENDGFIVIGGKLKKNPIYAGKKALVGDYLSVSSNNTKNVLKSLGFDVDVVKNSKDVVEKIKYGEKYDIIFSNNIYNDGTGPECLKELKKLQDFSIPVVIHTVSENKREYFLDEIGFDDYIVKPVTQENVKSVLKRLLDK